MRPLAFEPLSERARGVAAWGEVPAAHRPLDPGPDGQRPDPRRVEEVVPVAGRHSLAVEPVPQVEADREGVVADPPVEPPIHATADALRRSDGDREEVVLVQDVRPRGRPCGPLLGRVPREAERESQPAAEPLVQPLDDPAVEEDTGGQRIGQHHPNRMRHVPARPGTASATRSASDAPSSPW